MKNNASMPSPAKEGGSAMPASRPSSHNPTLESESMMVYSLVFDVVSSASRRLDDSSETMQRFDNRLVEMLPIYLEKFQLKPGVDVFPKFTGDGWILSLVQPAKLIHLVALGLSVQHNFHTCIEEGFGRKISDRWRLRIGMACGLDMKISLFNGQSDFLGDSIRRAVRICSMAQPGEFCCEGLLAQNLVRDFNVQWVSMDEKWISSRHCKSETDIRMLAKITGPRCGKLATPQVIRYLCSLLKK